MQRIKTLYAVIAGFLSMLFATVATAAVPAYVSTALTSAQSTLTEYLEASAPFLFAVTILIAAIFLIVKMIKRAAS